MDDEVRSSRSSMHPPPSPRHRTVANQSAVNEIAG